MENYVVLVDDKDKVIGTAPKLQAHQQGSLHRAFSIFIFNNKREMLLQQRANDKYHSGGLWTNACCSHPGPGEKIEDAAYRRLSEEMGFDCDLIKAFHFIYRTEFENGLMEHELDHVFIGRYDGLVVPNCNEVNNYKWINVKRLQEEINLHPELYTSWFKIALEKVINFQSAAI